MHSIRPALRFPAGLLFAALDAVGLHRRPGCSSRRNAADAAGERARTAARAALPVIRELPGRIAPTRIAEVRARVSGIVVHRNFEQGSDVKAGDVLYELDAEPFEIELDATRRRSPRHRPCSNQETQNHSAPKRCGRRGRSRSRSSIWRLPT